MTGSQARLRLELLSTDHAAALEAFERDNRAFFAARIGDRGDEFFEQFDDRLADRVAENDDGRSLLCVVVDAGGSIVARINVTDIDQPGETELGYRVAEAAQGHGVATWGVREALELAAQRGVRTVDARVAITNPASRRVLEHCGFTPLGAAHAPDGSQKTFAGYRTLL